MAIGRPHPLDRLVRDDSLFMLEAMIPFVDYNFKKPLIMLIKYQELNAILKCFDDPEYIAECGFDCHPQNSEDMIQSLCNIMPGYGNNMKQAMQMMNMMQMMQGMQNMQDNSMVQDIQNEPPPTSTDFEQEERRYYEDDYSQIDPKYYGSTNNSSRNSHYNNKKNPNHRNLYDSIISILDGDC